MNEIPPHSLLAKSLGYDRLFDSPSLSDPVLKWLRSNRTRIDSAFDSSQNGNLKRWLEVFDKLPDIAVSEIDLQNAVSAGGDCSGEQLEQLRDGLLGMHPWRKGPFNLFGIGLDTEWRSDLKWQRIENLIDWENQLVLDVGSGNGYYGWRMLGQGARQVIGLDPFLLYVMQYGVLNRYFSTPANVVLPLPYSALPVDLISFDITVSMGVLYHRSNPIDHLLSLFHSLKPGGQLLLETLIIAGDSDEVLVPRDRYAKMRNVWFLPTVPQLVRWLERCGFTTIELADETITTEQEQRRTEWMTFESLADFLDPNDSSRTIEGYPAPRRAVLTARRKS